MNSQKDQGFHNLYSAAIKAYPNKSKQKVQQDVVIIWKEIKKGEKNLAEELRRLQSIYNNTQGGYMKFWSSLPKQTISPPAVSPEEPNEKSLEVPSNVKSENTLASPEKNLKDAPAQNRIKEELNGIEKTLQI